MWLQLDFSGELNHSPNRLQYSSQRQPWAFSLPVFIVIVHMQEDPFTHFATLLATHFITALVFDGKARNAPGFFVGIKNLQPLLLPSFHWRLFASLPLSQCEHHARKKKE